MNPRTLVLHPGGALGDFILIWPLLRALRETPTPIDLVTAHSRAQLAAKILDLRSWADHDGRWSGLWGGYGADFGELDHVGRVIAFGSRPQAWRDAISRSFPGAAVEIETRQVDRLVALELAECERPAPLHDASRANLSGRGPIVLHAGSGGIDKQWPLDSWISVATALAHDSRETRLIAGEAEAERWDAARRERFLIAGGWFVQTLDELAETLRTAEVFVGADCGPGHLAAQLGLRTLTLFGPTDPARWAPIGPDVTFRRAASERLSDILPEEVLAWLAERPREGRM